MSKSYPKIKGNVDMPSARIGVWGEAPFYLNFV